MTRVFILVPSMFEDLLREPKDPNPEKGSEKEQPWPDLVKETFAKEPPPASCPVSPGEQQLAAIQQALARIEAKLDGLPLTVTDEMVSRFLGWRLPVNFHPDGHIHFDGIRAAAHGSWPIGTNLLDAQQARAMLEHVLGVRG